jgi:DHA1 family inner membrane transport protein
MGASTMAVIGGLPQIASGLHHSADAISGLVALGAVTTALAAPAVQVAFGHVDRKKVLVVGLTMAACATLLCALTASYAVFLLARIVAALGFAAIGPVASALGTSLVRSAAQGRALATVFLGMTLSSVLAAPACAWAAEAFGWRSMLSGIAGFDAVIAVLAAAGVPGGSRGQPLALRGLIDVLKRPGQVAALCVNLFHMAGVFATYTLIVPLLRERFGLSASLVSAALLTYGVAGLLGNVLVRRVSVAWSADRALVTAIGTLVAVYLSFGELPATPFLAFAALTSWAVCHDVFMPSQQRRLVEMAPDVRGLVLALNSSAIYVGMSAGASAAAAVDAVYGLEALPWASAALSALALLMLVLSRRAVRRFVPTLAG